MATSSQHGSPLPLHKRTERAQLGTGSVPNQDVMAPIDTLRSMKRIEDAAAAHLGSSSGRPESPPSRALRAEYASEEGGGLAPQQGPAAPEPGLHPEPRDDQGCVEKDVLAGDDAANHASMSARMRPCYAGLVRLKFADRRVTGGCDRRLIRPKLTLRENTYVDQECRPRLRRRLTFRFGHRVRDGQDRQEGWQHGEV